MQNTEFDWGEFLTLADSLVEEGGESEFRAAISRSYYAVFHKCRRFMRNHYDYQKPRRDEGSAHKHLWTALKNEKDRALTNIASRCIKLRDSRNWADYECRAGKSSPEADAKISIAAAKKIIEELSNWQ